jgi:hypothetical protein
LLNAMVVSSFGAAAAGAAALGLSIGFGAATFLAPGSLVVFAVTVWLLAKVPSGTRCAVYEHGIADRTRALRWEDCRIAPEATREFYGLWRSEHIYEQTSSFELLVLGPSHERFRIKGWGQPYQAYWEHFMNRVVPGQVERDLAAFDRGDPLRVGQLTVTREGFSHEHSDPLAWNDYAGMDLEGGVIRIHARAGGGPHYEVPIFLSGSHSLLVLLERPRQGS